MSAPSEPPTYKGEPLDAERGPGLGCFWMQIGLLTFFLVLTPLTVTWGWDSRISGALLIFTLILLLISGQTIIFLLRLVAADRRTRRAPLDPTAKPTVGQMEDRASLAGEPVADPAAEPAPERPADEAALVPSDPAADRKPKQAADPAPDQAAEAALVPSQPAADSEPGERPSAGSGHA